MTLSDYAAHYLSMPDLLIFGVISFAIVLLIHILLLNHTLIRGKREGWKSEESIYTGYRFSKEKYYELVFSASSMLLFTGIYFMMDYQWIALPTEVTDFWDKYSDFILLGLLLLSIILINIMDRFIIPLEKLEPSVIGALRMAGMIYMLVVFAYIKFIYEDDNYNKIILYFLTMLIGRYVYMDASFNSFRQSLREFLSVVPILLVVLLSTALLALYGFESGYLIRSDGVVTNLFLAHCFMMVEMFLLSVLDRLTGFSKRLCDRADHGTSRRRKDRSK